MLTEQSDRELMAIVTEQMKRSDLWAKPTTTLEISLQDALVDLYAAIDNARVRAYLGKGNDDASERCKDGPG